MNLNDRAVMLFQQWLSHEAVDTDTKQELLAISHQTDEIQERFYQDLAFGTGGIRGILGAGTNRVNRYTIGRATQGFAQYIIGRPAQQDGQHAAVIAYDSRYQSPELALEAALVLAGNGVKVHLFKSLHPTPALSFAVRYLRADAGIVITASHNPPQYNGYKIYGSDGGQLVPDQASLVIEQIEGVTMFDDVQGMDQAAAEQAGLLQWLDDTVDQAFVDAVVSVSRRPAMLHDPQHAVQIVYTPLHGAGNELVRRVLRQAGFEHVYVVPEQENPDPQFSTVASPNPEEREAFHLAIQLGETHQADIIIGTDPDCDRVGAVVRNDAGEYIVLTGNQAGALMIHYIAEHGREQGNLPANGIVLQTIVTSDMGAAIAEHYGLSVRRTLTGFKYIGELMTAYEHSNAHSFVFGYEESYGYLAGTHARDKDAVVASLLLCEVAAYYKGQGLTLYDVLQQLYVKHGWFKEKAVSRTLEGREGIAKIAAIMAQWREHPPVAIAGLAVEEVLDYAEGIDGLPQENVLKYRLVDGAWLCLRPSGTEPKLKCYIAVRGADERSADAQIDQISSAVMERIDQLIAADS